MKVEIKNNRIYMDGTPVIPNTNGTNGKTVQETSSKGLWFKGVVDGKSYIIYKRDLMKPGADPYNVHDVFFSYCRNEVE